MKACRLKIKRRDYPQAESYWEYFEVRGEGRITVVQALRLIQRRPVNMDNCAVAPVVWRDNCLGPDCSQCTMLINCRAALACRVCLGELDQPVCLEPLSRFPVVRDLLVDKKKMYDDQFKLNLVSAFEGFDRRPGLSFPALFSRRESDLDLVACTECGLCLEACPQYGSRNDFVGPALLAKARRYLLHHSDPTQKRNLLTVLAGRGGVADCDNAQNCVKACPAHISLQTAIGRLKHEVFKTALKNVFWN